MAPGVKETEGETGYIAASYIDKDRLYLVFSETIDADLPPLPADLCVVENSARINVVSLDLQLDQTQSVVVLLLESAPVLGGGLKVLYRPTQWMMSIEESGDAIEAFDEVVFPQSVDLLDPSLRLKSKLEPSVSLTSDVAKTVNANIRSASEYRIQLYFTESLDASMPLEISDFRAELEDRWLDITSAKYVKSEVDDTQEIRLELSEPMPSGIKVKVGYRSPSNRLRTQYAETVAPFSVEAVVDRNASGRLSDDEADLEAVAVTSHVTVEPQPLSEDEPSHTAEVHVDEAQDTPQALDTEQVPETPEAPAQDVSAQDLPVQEDPIPEEPIAVDALTESDSLDEGHEETPGAELDVDPLAGLDDMPEDWASSDLSDEPLELAFNEEESEASSNSAAPDENAEEALPASELNAEASALPAEKSQESAEAEVPSGVESDADATQAERVAVEDATDTHEEAPLDDSETFDSEAQAALTPSAAVAEEVREQGSLEQTPEIEKTQAETIAEKAARIQKALEAKTDLPATKAPLTLTAKIIYGIPIVVFAWLLIVVCIYVVTIVFDVRLGAAPQAVPEMPSGVSKRIPNETCSMKSADGSRYEGQCYKGKREGQGVYEWASGNRYEGQWLGGQRHGKGTLTYATGAVYEGEYRAGVEHGIGRMTWPNGAMYEGEYSEGKFHGRGVYRSADGSRFEGVFDRGSMTQNGTCTIPSGETHPGSCQAQ